ncbi:MAG: histidine kinase N-terminal 7TM domain-containing protein [Anaerolineae bacterium]
MTTLGLVTIIFLVLPALMSAYLGIYSMRRRAIPGATAFGITMFLIATWGLAAALVVISNDSATARLWLNVMFAFGAYLSVGILAATSQTTSLNNLFASWRLLVWLIIPTASSIIVLTSQSHQLFFYDIQFVQSGAQNIGWTQQSGPWSIVHLTYTYALIIYSAVLLVQQFMKLRYAPYRRRTLLLLAGLLLPFGANIANTLFLDVRTFITPILLNLSAPIFYWVLFRYRLFDLLPIARDQAFEHMDDAVIIINERDEVVDVNPRAAALAGQDAATLIEKPLLDVFPSGYREALAQTLGSNVRHQSIEVSRQQSPQYFDMSVVPIIRDNEQVGKLIVLADRTDQRLTEKRAHRMEAERERVRSLTEFVGVASHEFRTPLSIIKNSSYLLSRIDDPAKRAEKISQIDNQVNVLTRLIEGLLTIVRLDAEVELVFHDLDLNAVIQNAEQRVKNEAAAKNLHMDVKLMSGLPLVSGNMIYLQEAINAVLHNAVRFTQNGGSVTISTFEKGGEVVVRVQDTGIGIAPENLPRIFDVFYRVDQARTTAGFGTGLAIANRVVILHRGHIRTESQLGSGTTIELCFPPVHVAKSKTISAQPV